MKIGMFSAMLGGPWGGSEELWATTAHEALRVGHQVAISVPQWRPRAKQVQRLVDAGATLSERRRRPRSKTLRYWLDRITLRNQPFLNPRPDVICISQGSTYDFLTSNHPALVREVTLATAGQPYVVICQHNFAGVTLSPQLRRRALDFFELAAGVAFVAENNRTQAESQLAIRLAHAFVVRNPVNLDRIDEVPYPQPNGTLRLASVARFETPYKGQDILLEILAKPPWSDRPWELRLYGTGPDETHLRALANMLGHTERVRFVGHVGDIRAAWAENEILVLPSRQEGTPLALVEAMLCGRPAVVTDVGGNTEWIDEGTSGFVAEAPTPRSFGAALERAWQARAQWHAMGQVARAAALARYDPNPARTLLNTLEAAARSRSRAI